MLNAKPILPIFNIEILFTFYIVGLSVITIYIENLAAVSLSMIEAT